MFVLALFFSITLLIQLFGSSARDGLFYKFIYGTGKMLSGAYGFCSTLIPVFLFAASMTAFSGQRAFKKCVYIGFSLVPFWTAVAIEKIYRAVFSGFDGLTGFKVFQLLLTILIALLIIVIEYLLAGIIAERIYFGAGAVQSRNSLASLDEEFGRDEFSGDEDGEENEGGADGGFFRAEAVQESKPDESDASNASAESLEENGSDDDEIKVPAKFQDAKEGSVKATPAVDSKYLHEFDNLSLTGIYKNNIRPEQDAIANSDKFIANSQNSAEFAIKNMQNDANSRDAGSAEKATNVANSPQISQPQIQKNSEPLTISEATKIAVHSIEADYDDSDLVDLTDDEIAEDYPNYVEDDEEQGFTALEDDGDFVSESEIAEEAENDSDPEIAEPEFVESPEPVEEPVFDEADLDQTVIAEEASDNAADSDEPDIDVAVGLSDEEVDGLLDDDVTDDEGADGDVPEEKSGLEQTHSQSGANLDGTHYANDSQNEKSITVMNPRLAGGSAHTLENTAPAAKTAPAEKAKPELPKIIDSRFTRGVYNIPYDGILNEHQGSDYWVIDDATNASAAMLKETLEEFKISAEVTGIRKGPVVTMFEILPAPGVKLSKIVNLQDNIALRLAAKSVRIVAPIPGKRAVGIEVPNRDRAIVSFREIVEQELPEYKKMAVPVILGKDIQGEAQVIDLAKTPHLLIAGATGAGKSVCVNSIILSILYKRSPEQVKLILVDPKIVELKLYNDIPHLLTPVITEAKRALQSLQYCLCEMERRYALLDGMGVRDIVSYNKRIEERHIATEKLPYIVVIIDEFADLMATTGKELESTIARLCAMSRAVGIHLVLATQRPSIDVITGLIKANIPSRIAFMVASKIDSRIIIDQVGAEKLLGRGDMLFVSAVNPVPTRIQGTLVSDDEVEHVVNYVKQYGFPEYIDDEIFVDDEDDENAEPSLFDEGSDPLYQKALDIVIESGKASASYIQRRLKIGYNRAARLVEEMEERGIVGPANGSKPREIIHVP